MPFGVGIDRFFAKDTPFNQQFFANFSCYFRRADFRASFDANLLLERCNGVAGSRGEADQVNALRHEKSLIVFAKIQSPWALTILFWPLPTFSYFYRKDGRLK